MTNFGALRLSGELKMVIYTLFSISRST